MPPHVDTPHPSAHANAMMQERYAAAGGPGPRTVVAFAENIVKSLPLVPGASIRSAPGVVGSGELIVGSGRGIGFSSLSLHDPVNGSIVWAAPAYLGPADYLSARTVGPGAYLQPQPVPLSDGNIYLTDGHNLFSFVAETGELNWNVPHSGISPGPQRVREESALSQSLTGDIPVGLTAAPYGIRSPTGGWLVGGVYSRGSINYFDTNSGDPVIVKSAESQARTPSCLALDAGNNPVACPSFGHDWPLIYSIMGFLCFPGGQVSGEVKDWCSGLAFTRYFANNTTMVDPLRNRIVFTYAGSGGTVADGSNPDLFAKDFDLLKVWEFVTDNGAGQDGIILTNDSDGDGFGDAGIEEVFLAEIDPDSAATPTLSDSFEFLYGVDGSGTVQVFDASGSVAGALASATGAGVRASPSTDHNDSLVICSAESGMVRLSSDTGAVIWQNFAESLGLQRVPVVPDAPLVASGRPSQDCVGSPSTHIDAYQAQFVVGYPVAMLESLAALGVPSSSTLTGLGTVDFYADAMTGETLEAELRPFYNGSGEANVATLDNGRFVSARQDLVAATSVGIMNLILPRRFDVVPTGGGFVISEPVSFREAVVNQFQGAQRYCDELLNGAFIPDQDGDGEAEEISEGLPILVSGLPAEQTEQRRKLQLAVNKVGYLRSIMTNSLPGRMDSARSRGEIGALEASLIDANIAELVTATTTARDLLLGDARDRENPTSDPDQGLQDHARAALGLACSLVDQTLDILGRAFCASPADCDDGNDCTIESCVELTGPGETFCAVQDEPAGTACAGGGTCNGNGVCDPGGVQCQVDLDPACDRDCYCICAQDLDCDFDGDGDQCTVDRCVAGLCQSTPILSAECPSRSNLAAVWANDGGDKVAREESRASTSPSAVHSSVWDGDRVAIFGARNEVVSFNLVLEAPLAEDVRDVSVTFDTLSGSGGASIASTPASGDGVFNWVGRNIELFYVRYLQIKGLSGNLAYGRYDERHIPERFRRPWTGEGFGSGGWTDRPDHDAFYPDIAVPLELVDKFDIRSGENQSIWVDVYIPANASPGLYQGMVSISEAGERTREIPVELTVRDFTLPDVPTSKTMLVLGYEDINMRYVGETYPFDASKLATSKLVRDRHFQMAHRHRVSLIDNNAGEDNVDKPSAEWIARLDGSLFSSAQGYDGPGRDQGNGVFIVGNYGNWSWKGQGEAAMRQHTDAWESWFNANAPEVERALYLVDEPSFEQLAQVEQWAQWINDNPGPGGALKSLATLPFPLAETTTPSVDIPVAWGVFGITDVWQAAADNLAANPEKRAFMYNGVRPAVGSFVIDDDGVALRELAWSQYKKGIDRWFYWESTYYNNFQGGAGQTNVFAQAQTYGAPPSFDPVVGQFSWNYMNGDGVLFYPGTDTVYPQESYGRLGPFASLRLKHWRRGIQDVDYLSMAAQVDPGRVAAIVQNMVPKVLWEVGVEQESDPTYVRADISWSVDPDVWEAARSELADIIESAP